MLQISNFIFIFSSEKQSPLEIIYTKINRNKVIEIISISCELLKDIVQINAVLSFGAVTLDVKLTDFLFLFNLCIMIKFTLFSL